MVSVPESTASESSLTPEYVDDEGESIRRIRTRPLTSRQERKLVEYIEEMFLDIMRGYKKRNHPSTTLPTLHSYLCATHTLLSLILQIPPIKRQQAALRTALLLRLTSESLTAIPNYPLPVLNSTTRTTETQSGEETLRELLAWLDELDKGWSAVLNAQAWDAAAREGIDTEAHASDAKEDSVSNGENLDEEFSPDTLRVSHAVSQTDRARLRSLLLSGSSALEEWIEGVQAPPSTSSSAPTSTDISAPERGSEPELNRPDLESTLEQLGLQQGFDDLFSRTLGAMGELGGEVLNAGEELEME